MGITLGLRRNLPLVDKNRLEPGHRVSPDDWTVGMQENEKRICEIIGRNALYCRQIGS